MPNLVLVFAFSKVEVRRASKTNLVLTRLTIKLILKLKLGLNFQWSVYSFFWWLLSIWGQNVKFDTSCHFYSNLRYSTLGLSLSGGIRTLYKQLRLSNSWGISVRWGSTACLTNSWTIRGIEMYVSDNFIIVLQKLHLTIQTDKYKSNENVSMKHSRIS